LDGEDDLLDLAWSEKESENTSSDQGIQSAHLDLLREAFADDLDGTLEPGSASSTISTPSAARIRDPFQEPRDSSSLQLPHEHEIDSMIESVSSETHPTPSNMNPVQTSTELIQAVIRGSLEEVTDLLDNGYDIEGLEPENKRTGLMFAALLNHAEVLQLLLYRGANTAVQDRNGRTALHFAVSEGSCK
jgi:ankyrin repeat protein